MNADEQMNTDNAVEHLHASEQEMNEDSQEFGDDIISSNAPQEVQTSAVYSLPSAIQRVAEPLQQPAPPQNTFVRSTLQRPMTATQLESMRTGTYVQPGCSLADFICDLEQYTPAIPDAVAVYFMRKNGIDNPDPRVVRLFSLATQKFISDIALDAMQQARIKGLGLVRKGSRETRFNLTSQLLEPVLEEHGIKLERPPYYVG
jgi:transcription initiation factor TFIID subunit 10